MKFVDPIITKRYDETPEQWYERMAHAQKAKRNWEQARSINATLGLPGPPEPDWNNWSPLPTVQTWSPAKPLEQPLPWMRDRLPLPVTWKPVVPVQPTPPGQPPTFDWWRPPPMMPSDANPIFTDVAPAQPTVVYPDGRVEDLALRPRDVWTGLKKGAEIVMQNRRWVVHAGEQGTWPGRCGRRGQGPLRLQPVGQQQSCLSTSRGRRGSATSRAPTRCSGSTQAATGSRSRRVEPCQVRRAREPSVELSMQGGSVLLAAPARPKREQARPRGPACALDEYEQRWQCVGGAKHRCSLDVAGDLRRWPSPSGARERRSRAAARMASPLRRGRAQALRSVRRADTLPTHFRWPTRSTDGQRRPAMTTFLRPKAKVSSREPVDRTARSMAGISLTMEVLYQLS